MLKNGLKKRADGLYQTSLVIDRKPDGRPIRKFFYSRTLKELNMKAAEYERRYRLGILSSDETMTFGDLAKIWIDEYKPKIRDTTRNMYKHIVDKHLLPLAQYKLRDLKAHHLQTIINRLAVDGLAKSTMRKIKITAVQIMQVAMDNDIVYKNVFAGVKIPDIPPNARRPLTEEEQDLILKTYTGHRMGISALILLFCGIRRGELIALRWDDISLEDRALVISKGAVFIHNQPKIEQPKTPAGNRSVPIPDIIFDTLKDAKERAVSAMVCPAASGKMMSESAFRRAWDSYTHFLNIQAGGRDASRTRPKVSVIGHLTPHMFRHTYATILYDADVDVKSAQLLLGHTDVSVTLKIYTHLSLKKKTDASRNLNNHLNKRMMTS
jgi:integrase